MCDWPDTVSSFEEASESPTKAPPWGRFCSLALRIPGNALSGIRGRGDCSSSFTWSKGETTSSLLCCQSWVQVSLRTEKPNSKNIHPLQLGQQCSHADKERSCNHSCPCWTQTRPTLGSEDKLPNRLQITYKISLDERLLIPNPSDCSREDEIRTFQSKEARGPLQQTMSHQGILDEET